MMRGKKFILAIAALATMGLTAVAPAASLTENFDNVESLFSNGWVRNNLSNPPGAFGWVQNNATLSGFDAHSGAADSAITANFELVSEEGTISDWLLTPSLTFENGDKLVFWSRTAPPSDFGDRLQVRMSTNGASTDVGTTESSVGDFTNLLLEINPNQDQAGYPDVWTQYTIEISGLSGPTAGRIGFRYFVIDGGEFGNFSNIIGVDTLSITPVPEPASIALGAGLLGLGFLRRRRG